MADPARGERRPFDPRRAFDWRTLGWRGGLLLGAIVLLVVYAVAELTAAVPALRDGLEHLPVTIVVLVVGTIAVLVSLLRPSRRG